jgi:hypothetical protein
MIGGAAIRVLHSNEILARSGTRSTALQSSLRPPFPRRRSPRARRVQLLCTRASVCQPIAERSITTAHSDALRRVRHAGWARQCPLLGEPRPVAPASASGRSRSQQAADRAIPTMIARMPGLVPGDGGNAVGRDPREMTAGEFRQLGHEPMTAQAALRLRCLDCCAGSTHEVRCCVSVTCPAWPFRLGRSPWRAPLSASEKSRRRQLLSRVDKRVGNSSQAEKSGSVEGGSPATVSLRPERARSQKRP